MADSVTPVGLQAEHKRDVIFEVAAGRDTGARIAAHVRMVQPAGSRDVTIIADEGAHRGGGDSAPNALAYFSAALAF